jgi:hypothetical protein
LQLQHYSEEIRLLLQIIAHATHYHMRAQISNQEQRQDQKKAIGSLDVL